MSFDHCNRHLKIQESIGTPIPKMRVHLGVWVHSLTLFCTPRSMKCDSRAQSWPTPLQTLALVTSPRLGLRHKWVFEKKQHMGVVEIVRELQNNWM
jgi:hypothetical protein